MPVKSRTIALLFAGGVFLGQLAWISAVPPYRGIDEFDHVYRAASVAEGYWGPGVGTPRAGRGDLVPVPPEIVTDGAEICRSFKYTGPDNCRAATTWTGELVTVASAASRYNPAFYWLIGKPSQLAEGAQAVYVMRFVASLVCALLVGLAAWATCLWSRTRWPLAALSLALTPVVVYSAAMPAPNGIEMAGALCLWCGLLGLSQVTDRRVSLRLVTVATVGAIPLALVRSLGPLWLIMSLAVILALVGRTPVRDVLRRIPMAASFAFLLVTAVVGVSVWWSRFARTNALEPMDIDPISPWVPALQEVPLWFLQSIAAFPLRNEPAPTVVYAIGVVVFTTFVSWAFARASSRQRITLVATGLLSLAVPYAITIATVMVAGLIWQGRYTLPFSFGVVLIAGLVLEQARATSRIATGLLVIFGALTSLAHVVSVVNVQRAEGKGSPLAGDARWVSLPLWVVGALAACSVALWTVAVLRGRPSQPDIAVRTPGDEDATDSRRTDSTIGHVESIGGQ